MLTEELLIKLHPLLSERIITLSEINDWIDYFIEEPEVDIGKFKKLDKELLKQIFNICLETNIEELESTLRNFGKLNNLKVGQVFQPIRIAISGKEVALPLFESMNILGEEKCRSRITSVLNQIF